ncbi:MAG: hypothetical protein ACXVE8_04955 [Solirubrobacteraceae bacterium]
MKQFQISRRSLSMGICGILSTAVAFASAAPAMATQINTSGMDWGDISSCFAPSLTQPFLSVGDSNWYTLAPGETPGSFNGAGWALSGGASIQPGQNGAGAVLDLPSGSQAISPPMCVASDYPTARTMVRDVVGAEGVQVGVAYAGTRTETNAQTAGQVHGQHAAWTLSNPFNIHPGNLPGWQLVRFTLVPGGKSSDFQVYNFYVDPRLHY